MSLNPGTRLGVYEVTAKIVEGGHGGRGLTSLTMNNPSESGGRLRGRPGTPKMRWSRSVATLIGAVSVAIGTAGSWVPGPSSRHLLAASAGQPPLASPESVRSLLDRYCVTCHSERRVTGSGEPASLLDSQIRDTGLALDLADGAQPSANAELWERVLRRLKSGSMPPAGRPRPGAEETRAVTRWLETRLDQAASANPNPGRNGSMHRLNRTEYGNAIRDLLALEIDVAALLPGDETSDTGFDNNAEVLSISTAQLERYLSAARKISRLATGITTAPEFARFENSVLLTQTDRQSEDLPLGSRGGLSATYQFPADGTYIVRIALTTNWQDYVRGMGRRNLLDLRIDGALVERFTVGGEAPGTPAPTTWSPAEAGDPEWERYVRESAAHLEVRVLVEGGPHVVGVSFVRNRSEPEGPLQPVMKGAVLSNDEKYHGHAEVQALTIEGPYEAAVPEDTPSRRNVFVCQPTTAAEEEACAERIMSRLARLAYRRSPTEPEINTLLEFFRDGRAKEGGSFDTGIQLALERLLVDPDFLLRVQEDPPGAAPGQAYALSDLELASRLSFFLWSSIPDAELLDVAERGALADPAAVGRQVRRMLADPRSEALVSNFAAQWLHLRNLDEVKAEPSVYPEFDQDLVEAFRQETLLFIASTIREDRSILDLLGADYTYLNERLARHYGVGGIYGSRFRRVTLPDLEQRGGLLGHGSLLSLTSYPDRTSPVLRGRWLLESIFGAPPPGPPPNVPPLPERGENNRPASVRERLELHRRNPVCASCHRTIDPPGFMLEHYDAIGRWRSVTEEGRPVDALGTMPNGVTAEGLAGLRGLLLDEPEQFVTTLTERLLAYALGRQPEYFDQPTVRTIVRNAAADQHRWASVILGIVDSPAFLMRRTAE